MRRKQKMNRRKKQRPGLSANSAGNIATVEVNIVPVCK
jgi:hypothetical protein